MYRGNNTRRLLLRHFPIISTETFTFQYRTTITNESDWDSVETEDYFVDYDSGIVTALFDFQDYPDHYRFSYTAGFDYDNVATFLSSVGAADLEYACWKLVNAIFTQRKNSGNIQSESIGDYSVTFTTEVMIDDELKDILSRYKRMYG